VKNLTFDQGFKIIIATALLLVSVSVSYYFVIYIPQQERLEMEEERRAKQEIEEKERIEKADSEEKLAICLSTAERNFANNRAQFCRDANAQLELFIQKCVLDLGANDPLCKLMEKEGNRPDNCALGGTDGQKVKDRYAKAKNNCYSNFGG